MLSPLVPVHQHGVEAAGGEPGDPQESACQRHHERGTLIALRQRNRLQLLASRSSAKAALPSALIFLPQLHPHFRWQTWLSGVSQKSSSQTNVWSLPLLGYLAENTPGVKNVPRTVMAQPRAVPAPVQPRVHQLAAAPQTVTRH